MANSTKKLLFNLINRSLILMVCTTLMAGCKKNDPEPSQGDYYVKFKVNGVQKDYRFNVVAYRFDQSYSNSTYYSLGVSGF